MAKQLMDIPRSVIEGAVEAKPEALGFVLGYFSGYITKLATRTLKDDYGNEYAYLDENLRLRLEDKLVRSIISNFDIDIA